MIVNGKKVGEGKLPKTILVQFSLAEGLHVGSAVAMREAKCIRNARRREAMSARSFTRLIASTAIVLCAWPAIGQEILPKPEPPFSGVIGQTYRDSKEDYPQPI